MELVNQFKSLGDETRLRLLNLLLHHELSVNEIVSVMEMGQSRISRHLKILTDSGFLSSRRDGLWVFYSGSKNGKAQNLLRSLVTVFEIDEELKKDLNRLKGFIKKDSERKIQFFDSIAADWESIKGEIIGEVDVDKEIFNRINNSKITADIGCGTGGLLGELNKRSKRVIGVDNSPNMLNQARQRLGDNLETLELRLGELEHLPMREDEADTVILNMILHHVVNPSDGILEAGRVLARQGQLIIIDLEKHNNEEMRTTYGHRWLGFSKNEISNWLKNAGMKLVDEIQFEGQKGLKINLFVGKKGLES